MVGEINRYSGNYPLILAIDWRDLEPSKLIPIVFDHSSVVVSPPASLSLLKVVNLH